MTTQRPSKEWYAEKITETDGLDNVLPIGALATPQPAPTIQDSLIVAQAAPAEQERPYRDAANTLVQRNGPQPAPEPGFCPTCTRWLYGQATCKWCALAATAEQAMAEMHHAYFSPNWFTDGKQGATQQFLLWHRKGLEAIAALRQALNIPKEPS